MSSESFKGWFERFGLGPAIRIKKAAECVHDAELRRDEAIAFARAADADAEAKKPDDKRMSVVIPEGMQLFLPRVYTRAEARGFDLGHQILVPLDCLTTEQFLSDFEEGLSVKTFNKKGEDPVQYVIARSKKKAPEVLCRDIDWLVAELARLAARNMPRDEVFRDRKIVVCIRKSRLSRDITEKLYEMGEDQTHYLALESVEIVL